MCRKFRGLVASLGSVIDRLDDISTRNSASARRNGAEMIFMHSSNRRRHSSGVVMTSVIARHYAKDISVFRNHH